MKVAIQIALLMAASIELLAFTIKSQFTIIDSSVQNTVEFEISPYGLLFTGLVIEGDTVKAMIDFGDPNILQLSSTYVSQKNLAVDESGGVLLDLMGNQFKINQGILNEVLIGTKEEKAVPFSSSPGEMESVSQQIDTEFHAVVGWGYFSQYYTTLEYAELKFTLRNVAPVVANAVANSSVLDNDSYLILPITVGGKNVNALIDTGSPVSLVDKTLGLESLSEFVIGESRIEESFIVEDLSVLKDLDVSVMLGGTFLSKYKVHIYPTERKIVLE